MKSRNAPSLTVSTKHSRQRTREMIGLGPFSFPTLLLDQKYRAMSGTLPHRHTESQMHAREIVGLLPS